MLFARLTPLLHSPLRRNRLGQRLLEALMVMAPFFAEDKAAELAALWADRMPPLVAGLQVQIGGRACGVDRCKGWEGEGPKRLAAASSG